MKRRLSGIKPTGKLHLGNYFGAIKQFIEKQNSESFFFVADYHALTTLPSKKELEQNSLNIVIDYLALGLTEANIFIQSYIKEHTELAWILSNVTPIGLLQRAHAYKDKLAKNEAINAGLFYYPVLMSADILIYQPDLVPVGKDQKQHLEMARDIALKFNSTYGNIFKIPNAEIIEELHSIPGIDGRKMSKSYNNTIEIFGSEKEISKAISSIVTDSKSIDEVKDFNTCNIYNILKPFLSASEKLEIENRYLTGIGYGELKKYLLGKILEFTRPLKAKREELLNNMDYVESFLEKSTKRARSLAVENINKIKEACGLLGRS